MRRLQALIFNFDGTLADTAQAWRNAFNLSFADHGLACWFDDSVGERRYFRSARETEWIARLGKRHQLDQETIRSVLGRRNFHFNAMIRSGLVPMRSDTKALIQQASAKNVMLAVATMGERETVMDVIEQSMGPEAVAGFAAIQCRPDGGAGKPDPEIYTRLIDRLGVSPLDCVAVESSSAGVSAAYQAGIYTIGLKDRRPGGELLKPADIVLDTLSPTPGRLLAAAGGPKAPPLVTDLASIV
jgi:beta-phosphoglucomutase-like phosphatase (HAD superfamily)